MHNAYYIIGTERKINCNIFLIHYWLYVDVLIPNEITNVLIYNTNIVPTTNESYQTWSLVTLKKRYFY